jgi:hypothetical protein
MPKSGIRLGGTFYVDAYNKYGRYKWSVKAHNVVMKQGIQNLLDAGFSAGTQVDPWYVGLLASTAVLTTYDLTDLQLATEFTGDRPAYVETRSSETLTNAAAKSTFTCDKDATTVEGALLASSNSMKGTTGILLCAAPFTGGTKVADSGDKLIVTYVFSAIDDA